MSFIHVVVVDTAQIQPYVFGSNRLRENIGASHLVALATGAWATALLEPGELVYAGGGNVVARFEEADRAGQFVRSLSRRALAEAPGLRLVAETQEFAPGWLRAAVRAAFERLADRKRGAAQSAPLLGLSVTERCGTTGLPATARTLEVAGDPSSVYPASSEVLCKRAAAEAARDRLADPREGAPPGRDFDFPADFSDLGRSVGEDSYIAVVHADGNGLGKRIQALGEGGAEDEAYAEAVGSFSASLHRLSLEALRVTVGRLRSHYTDSRTGLWDRIPLRQTGRSGVFLPMRPLVFGGDDVTFVCDGRLGPALAECYLQAFERLTRDLPGGPATACAGVAIVKTQYPFARAYALAEDLCRSAKGLHRRLKEEGRGEQACLDWHFTSSGLFGGLGEIRGREYRGGDLTLRPVSLGGAGGVRRWETVRRGIDAFQGRDWAERRSKVKALRDALREGPEAVRHFCLYFNRSADDADGLLPDVGRPRVSRERGWEADPLSVGSASRCVYFDAVELFDHFVALDAPGDTP